MARRAFALCICDIQPLIIQRSIGLIHVRDRVDKLLKARPHLPAPLPTFAAQLLPEKFGDTRSSLPVLDATEVFAKPSYSMVDARLLDQLQSRSITDVILTGFETHWCVTASALDLLQHGFTVHVPEDCVMSQSFYDHSVALRRLERFGVFPTTVRGCLASLVGDDVEAGRALVKQNVLRFF